MDSKEIFDPELGVVVKVGKSCCGIPSAILNVFAHNAIEIYQNIKLDMVVICDKISLMA